MKRLAMLLLIGLFLMFGCKSKPEHLNHQEKVGSNDIVHKNVEIISDCRQKQIRDSIIELKLYLEGEERTKKEGKLRSDVNIKQKKYNYKLNADGNESRSTLYHIGDRIVRIEKRIYDSVNNQLAFSMFEFDEKSSCYSNTQWNNIEKMSFTNAMFWDTINRFDDDYKPIFIDSVQKKQIIESTKAELDSIMQHFPGFTYTFNWK